jgi:4-diphosphocytidyl-2-C-methyl-D-erythritol kinase
MISFPHAKINLGLSVVSKRSDGFHNLETIIYPLPLRDALEIVTGTKTKFIPSGLPIPGQPTDNLVLRAFHLLKKAYPQIAALEIYLHKAIPMEAGLGGGSSDAAGIIKMINQYFNLGISKELLFTYALELGSDCPFFIQSEPCYATSRGEVLEPIALDLSAYTFILVHPPIRISTAWAFSKIEPVASKSELKQTIMKPIEQWAESLHNDFEIPVFKAHPVLKKIKEQLYAAGALYASMTGSGSTIYGIFEKNSYPEIRFEHASVTYLNG